VAHCYHFLCMHIQYILAKVIYTATLFLKMYYDKAVSHLQRTEYMVNMEIYEPHRQHQILSFLLSFILPYLRNTNEIM